MTYRLRPATAADKSAIADFTQDTFDWGDYVAREFEGWLADAASTIVVAVDDSDTAIAMATGTLLSPTELWIHGTRVHPEWRRRGIASTLLRHLEQVGRDRGADVARLLIDDWNTPAIEQVTKLGMRHTSDWTMTHRTVVARAPVTKSNGGRRRPPTDRLNRAVSAEAHAAYVAWSSGELGRASRGLVAVGWRWRRLHVDDLLRAARAEALWMSPAGWVMAGVDQDTLEIGWMETGPEQAFELAKSAIDLAAELGAERIEVKVPSVPWLTGAFDALGFESSNFLIFEEAL